MAENCERLDCIGSAAWDVVVTLEETEHRRYYCGYHYSETARVLRDLDIVFVSRVR